MRRLGLEGGMLLAGINALIRRTSEGSLAPSTVRGHTGSWQSQPQLGRGPSPGAWPHWHPELRFSASRTVRRKIFFFFFFIGHQSMEICYSSPQ